MAAVGGNPVAGVVVTDAPDVALENDDERAWHLLTVTCDDRSGLLADLSEHIRCCGVDIVSASVATDTDSGLIVDSFAVRAHLRSRPHSASHAGCHLFPALPSGPQRRDGRPAVCGRFGVAVTLPMACRRGSRPPKAAVKRVRVDPRAADFGFP